MSKKVLFWVKSQSKDFNSISMQALKIQANRYELNFLYNALFFESIDNQGVLTNEQIELLSLTFLDMDFDNNIKILGKLKLITIQEDEVLIEKVYNNYESIQSNSIKRQEQRLRKKENEETNQDNVLNETTENDNVAVNQDNVLNENDNVANKTTKTTVSDNKSKEENIKVKEELEIELKIKKDKEIKKEEINNRFNNKFKKVAEANNKRNIKEEVIEVSLYYYTKIRANLMIDNTKKDLAIILSKNSKQDIINSIKNYDELYEGDRIKMIGINKFFKDNYFSVYLNKNISQSQIEKEIRELKNEAWLFENADIKGKLNSVGENRVNEIYERYGVKQDDIIEAEFKVVEVK